MKTDTKERRLRHAGRQPLGRKILLTSQRLALFEVLQRHGTLPTNFLHAFAGGNHNSLQLALTNSYNESNNPHGAPYLERPWQQFQSFNARYQPVIYELTDTGRLALSDHGKLDKYAQPITGHYIHRFMTACITASLELAATEAGFRFISQEEIFKHDKCPESTRQAKNPLELPALMSTLIPDQLFGIEYQGKFRFYALEADRNHETIASKELAKNSYGRKIKGYSEIFGNKIYKTVWGIPNLRVLTVTTNTSHMHSMISYAKENTLDASPFLFACKSEFGRDWKVPGLLKDLFCEPWLTTADPYYINRA